MQFAISAEQEQFAASLHEMLSAETEKHWPRLTDLGVSALLVPEASGGLGGDAVDLVVAFEELGHHAVPGPLAESMAAVPTLLAELGDKRWLPGLASGDHTATWSGWAPGRGSVITLCCTPHLPFAADADTADLVLTIDGDTVRTDDGTVVATSVAPAIGRAFDMGTLACAAQLVGAGRAMLELTVGYAKRRTQFGRPIGAFQAVKHRLADVLVGLELARPLVHAAAVAMTARSDTAGRDVSAARIAAAQAAHSSARAALQVHGAIGYTLEYELSRWLALVRTLRPAWGSLPVHRARIMAAVAHGGTT